MHEVVRVAGAHDFTLDLQEGWRLAEGYSTREIQLTHGAYLVEGASGDQLHVRSLSDGVFGADADSLEAFLRAQSYLEGPHDVRTAHVRNLTIVSGWFSNTGTPGGSVIEWYFADGSRLGDAATACSPDKVEAHRARCDALLKSLQFAQGDESSPLA